MGQLVGEKVEGVPILRWTVRWPQPAVAALGEAAE
jgi:hypothetical protein